MILIDSLIKAIVCSDWLVLTVVGATLLLATEAGFRFGLRHKPELRKARHGQSGALQGALLGLLGLLLGFTFAMAVGRYEARKQLVLAEANSIGTTWLRAGFLTPGTRDLIRPALLDYVDARLAAANAPAGSPEFLEQLGRSEVGQAAMWRATVSEVRTNDTPATSLFVVSLNELIDLDAERLAASRNHVPNSVWMLLLIVASTVCWTTGYSTGLGEAGRHALPMIVLPVLLAIVTTIIADIDNPRRGLIKVSQQSMVDLQRTLLKHQ